MRKSLFAGIAACIFGLPAIANAACNAPAYHQYDYFVGHWRVYHADGKPFARDVVTKELGGCALLEQWFGAASRGKGYSAYDSHTKRWVQTFFEDDGTILIFHGNSTAQGMLFSGDDYTDSGTIEHNKVLFRPLHGGGFEEYWTTSADGKAWKVVFDGFFKPESQK